MEFKEAQGRSLKIYSMQTKGDVIGPERVGDNYIVAVVTEVNKPGLQSVNRGKASS